MEAGTPSPDERPEELELAPKPRIKKLSSAIVWIVAIFAVAVLWMVGFLVSSKTRRPASERRTVSVTPPVGDLAERIQRAAEREARLAAEREAAERAQPEVRALPPGFEELLASEREDAEYGPERYSQGPRQQPAPDPRQQSLQRALDAELVPTAFRTSAPRAADASEPRSRGGLPPMPDLEELREQILRTKEGQEAAVHSPQASEERGHSSIQSSGSPFRLTAGTLIPAILTAGINSELPGQTTALVRRNVYDTLTGRYLLIPQGARLVGEYDSRVAFGQKRVLVAWSRLIFPDGRSVDLGELPGTDLSAAAGLHDKVDNHFVRTFGSALMLAAVSAGVQLSQPEDDGTFNSAPSPSHIAADAVGQELGRVSTEYLRRNMDVRPTLEVRPGYELNVEVTSDLELDGPYTESATSSQG